MRPCSDYLLLFLIAGGVTSVSTFPFDFPTAGPWVSFRNLSGCHRGESRPGLANLKRYLNNFGYLPSAPNFTGAFDAALEAALAVCQRNFGLNATGALDEATVGQLAAPRCGVPDVINGTSTMNSSALRGRNLFSYFPGKPTWPRRKTQLRYAITASSAVAIDANTLRAVLARAFGRWAAATTLAFEEAGSAEKADITIGFYSGAHGDGEPFDGVLGTLAHAFAPRDGRFHFDAAETWVAEGDVTRGSDVSVDLESVAVHEIGHLLGLGHSSVAEAIMYPTIRTRTRKVDLASDDVKGIQSLYSRNPNYTGPPPTTIPTASSRETNSGGEGLRVRSCWGQETGWALTALAVWFVGVLEEKILLPNTPGRNLS